MSRVHLESIHYQNELRNKKKTHILQMSYILVQYDFFYNRYVKFELGLRYVMSSKLRL